MEAIAQALIREIFIGLGVRGLLISGATAIWESRTPMRDVVGLTILSQPVSYVVIAAACPKQPHHKALGIYSKSSASLASRSSPLKFRPMMRPSGSMRKLMGRAVTL